LVPLAHDIILVGQVCYWRGVLPNGCSKKLERVIKREAEESDRIEGQTEREADEEVINEDRERGSQRTKQLG